MIKSKVLTDTAWKDVLAKNKTVKDNGLLKALADINKLGDADHDATLSLLDQTQKLIAQLKKSKELAAAPAAGKFLAELTAAADTAAREVAKAKVEAEKSAKAKAEADKKAQATSAKTAAGDEDDEDASPELLTTKLTPLLRMVAKGETMQALLAKSGKQVVVMLSRKPIPPARRKMLADQLGGGSTKYFPGHCHLEAGATTFVLKAEVAGMSKLVKAALLAQTGLRLNKVKCRGEDGDDDDIDDNDAAADTANGAANDEPGAAAPGAPASVAQLAKARLAWNTARTHAVSELARLKKILQDEYRDAGSEQAALAKALQRVDATVNAINDELNDRLNQVASAQVAQRAAQLAAAKVAVQRLITLVSSDEVLQNIDGNELAPDMLVAAPLRARLTEIAQSLQ
jgi:hypothetical protein